MGEGKVRSRGRERARSTAMVRRVSERKGDVGVVGEGEVREREWARGRACVRSCASMRAKGRAYTRGKDKQSKVGEGKGKGG